MNSKRRDVLLKSWYDATMRSYFPEADATFLTHTGFANPVGQNFQQSMMNVLDGLIGGLELESFRAPVDRIVRILAVQGLPAGMSIRFLTLLRRQLQADPGLTAEEKAAFCNRLDALSEMAVEIWLECRETLSALRINELRKRLQLLETGSIPKD